MPHLLNVWPSVARRLENADSVLLLFDYDGTLTPIVARPEDALLSADVRDLLTRLSETGGYVVGIVSGRSLADLKQMVAIPGLVYAGNHGLEIDGPGIEFVHSEAMAALPALDELFGLLPAALADIPGVAVEHKGLTLTVHYRGVPDAYADAVDDAVTAAARPFVTAQMLRLTQGKKVVEVRPNVEWHKGKAIDRIREAYPGQPFRSSSAMTGPTRTASRRYKSRADSRSTWVRPGPPRRRYTNWSLPPRSPKHCGWSLEIKGESWEWWESPGNYAPRRSTSISLSKRR